MCNTFTPRSARRPAARPHSSRWNTAFSPQRINSREFFLFTRVPIIAIAVLPTKTIVLHVVPMRLFQPPPPDARPVRLSGDVTVSRYFATGNRSAPPNSDGTCMTPRPLRPRCHGGAVGSQSAARRFRLLDSLAMAMVTALISAAAAPKSATRNSPLPAVVPATRVAAIRGAKPPPSVEDNW